MQRLHWKKSHTCFRHHLSTESFWFAKIHGSSQILTSPQASPWFCSLSCQANIIRNTIKSFKHMYEKLVTFRICSIARTSWSVNTIAETFLHPDDDRIPLAGLGATLGSAQPDDSPAALIPPAVKASKWSDGLVSPCCLSFNELGGLPSRAGLRELSFVDSCHVTEDLQTKRFYSCRKMRSFIFETLLTIHLKRRTFKRLIPMVSR